MVVHPVRQLRELADFHYQWFLSAILFGPLGNRAREVLAHNAVEGLAIPGSIQAA